jgi:hypothetical protein
MSRGPANSRQAVTLGDAHETMVGEELRWIAAGRVVISIRSPTRGAITAQALGPSGLYAPPPLPSQIDFAIDVLAAMPFWIVILILVGAALARLTEWSVGKPPQLRCLSLRSSGTPQ